MPETLPPPTHRKRKKTHCAHGHEFTPENTYIRYPDGDTRRPQRVCRTCRRERRRIAANWQPKPRLTRSQRIWRAIIALTATIGDLPDADGLVERKDVLAAVEVMATALEAEHL